MWDHITIFGQKTATGLDFNAEQQTPAVPPYAIAEKWLFFFCMPLICSPQVKINGALCEIYS